MSTEDNSLSKFIEIYEEYKDVVFDTAMAHCDNYHTAQEVAQEVFAECYMKKMHLEEDVNLCAWFKITAKNRVIDYWRKVHKEELRYEIQESDILGEFNSMEEMYIHELNVSKRREQGYSILEEIRRKNKRWYDFLIMRYYFGIKEKDVAEKLNTTEAAVKNAVQRAQEWVEKNYGKNKDT